MSWHPMKDKLLFHRYCSLLEDFHLNNVFSMLWNRSRQHRGNSSHPFRSKSREIIFDFLSRSQKCKQSINWVLCQKWLIMQLIQTCLAKESTTYSLWSKNSTEEEILFNHIRSHLIEISMIVIDEKPSPTNSFGSGVKLTVPCVSCFVRLNSRAKSTTPAAKRRNRSPV